MFTGAPIDRTPPASMSGARKISVSGGAGVAGCACGINARSRSIAYRIRRIVRASLPTSAAHTYEWLIACVRTERFVSSSGVDAMDVSIIICTANRAADLRETLRSLADIRQCGSVELIVVDNCSRDATRAT